MQSSKPESTRSRDIDATDWDRKCVICGYKWHWADSDECKYCLGQEPIESRAELLAQAKVDVHEAMVAIEAEDWVRADIFLKLAIDQIADARVARQ